MGLMQRTMLTIREAPAIERDCRRTAIEGTEFGLFDARFGSQGLPNPSSRDVAEPLMQIFTRTLRCLVAAGFAALFVVAIAAAPARAEPRAIVELFTSQGCSACPPADKVLGELARDPSVIALSLPVDYWDYLGWKDTLADAQFTARQKAYSRMRRDRDMYTPQMIVNGTEQVNGRDRAAIERAMGQTRRNGHVMMVPVSATPSQRQLSISLPDVANSAAKGEVWLFAISRAVPVTIERGENRGKEVTYTNVVRGWLKVGDWNGTAGHWTVPLENILRDGVDAAVIYVQDGSRDNPGMMLGATLTSLR